MTTIEPTAKVPRPRPYQVDRAIHKVQTLDEDGDDKYLFRHDFARLDATNVGLLLEREKETKRITEKLGKGRSRGRLRSEKADRDFYTALITGGGWRPFGLEPKAEEGLIEPSMKQYYSLNSDTNLWEPGWIELDKATMQGLTIEKMSEAIERWLMCKGKKVKSGSIDFMFEKAGIMKIGLLIGDPDEPAYKLLFEMRRPDDKRRTKFKDDFAYAIDHSKGGEMGKVETIIDLRQGIGFFDEYLSSCPEDEEYSQIVFQDKRDFGEQGREPKQISAVPVEGEEAAVDELVVRPYSEEIRGDLINYLNPHFKVEVAAAVISSFSKTDQES